MKLIPKTLKGRNRIREAGTNQVHVTRRRDSVAFSTVPGPWAFVMFEGTNANFDRWVHLTHDPDFEVTEEDANEY